MKLFKKVLAMALASALALTLLVGCGSNGKTTYTLVEYLNDYQKMYGSSQTYKAEASLDANAKNVAELVKKSGAKTPYQFQNKLQNDEKLYEDLLTAVGVNKDTAEKYLYQVSYTFVSSDPTTDLATKSDVANDQIGTLMNNVENVSAPESVKVYPNWDTAKEDWQGKVDETKLDSTSYMGTAELQLGTQKYLVAVFRTAAK